MKLVTLLISAILVSAAIVKLRGWHNQPTVIARGSIAVVQVRGETFLVPLALPTAQSRLGRQVKLSDAQAAELARGSAGALMAQAESAPLLLPAGEEGRKAQVKVYK